VGGGLLDRAGSVSERTGGGGQGEVWEDGVRVLRGYQGGGCVCVRYEIWFEPGSCSEAQKHRLPFAAAVGGFVASSASEA